MGYNFCYSAQVFQKKQYYLFLILLEEVIYFVNFFEKFFEYIFGSLIQNFRMLYNQVYFYKKILLIS